MNELSQQTGMPAPLSPPFCPPFDTPAPADHAFEAFLAFKPAKREALLASLVPQYEALRPRDVPGKRNWKAKDYSNFCSVLALVVANAFSAAQHPLSQSIRYSRTNKDYSRRSVYRPDFLGARTLKNVVGALAKLGFLDLRECVSGYGDVPTEPNRSFRQQSTFKATGRLLGLLKELGVSATHLVRDLNAPVIHLHNKTVKRGKKWDDKRREWIAAEIRVSELAEFDPNEPTAASITEAIRSYNAFLGGSNVTLDVDNAEFRALHAKPRKDGSPRPPVNTSQKALFRSFNEDLEHGGRFFGGWWINIPSEYRQHIRIDGAPTVELDYSGCFIRMLYHLEGIDLEEDPYAIPAIVEAAEKQHLDWEDVRDGVKELTNIYINALDNSRIGKFPEATRRLPKGLKRPNAVYPLIYQHHYAIRHRFRSGCALELMKIEADICQDILMDGLRNRVPVLPIHDSFVVPEQHEEWLHQAMMENYRKRLKFDPKIKRKEKNGKVQKDRVTRLESIEEKRVVGGGITGYPRPVPLTSSSLGKTIRDQTLNLHGRLIKPPEHNSGIWVAILTKHQSPDFKSSES